MCNVKQNAFLAICRACNEELRLTSKDDYKAQKPIIKKHGDMAESLGFSVTAMKVKIGQLNGVLRERG
ncbi:hypothetical protein NVP1276O_57 [Vibrio phage 1.276.O._10N.286.54.E4]|nr:hypothetical protein NVP1276O_57 [Vibrio phage 1.276.O._10N.286.54.E4]